jgi:two-component system, OmpR family, phosphate regulon sensor histidine kinase PhoR
MHATGEAPRSSAPQVVGPCPAARIDDLLGVGALELLEAIADGVVIFDRDGRVVHTNAAAAEMWRAAGAEAPWRDGFDPAKLVFRAEDGRLLCPSERPVARALRGERVHGLRLCLCAEGARPIWLVIGAAPIRDAAGALAGAIVSCTDETQAHTLADERDDLVRMVSHDLRTPLSAIYGQAHLIRRGGEPAERIRERATSIERSCERMSGMIQDLVEVTLLEAGQLPVARARVDVAALVPDILDGMRGGLDVERVRLDLCQPCWADVDPSGLERIVVNLASNALKYSSDEVRLSLRREAGAVVLQIADRGVGISPDDQARVFERYFRAVGNRRPEGLGLGLYITRLLVEAQGGRIEVESRLGQGSTFRVLFPGAAAEGG